MAFTVLGARRELAHALRHPKRDSRGRVTASYLGSPVPVLGVPIPAVRRVTAKFARTHASASPKRMLALSRSLWSRGTFEERVLAIDLARRWTRILPTESWELANQWVDSATGWGLSDELASRVIGPIAYGSPERFKELLRWTRSPNPWRRRSAAYAIGAYVSARRLARPFRLLTRLLRDRDLWVQRAVGTWLRESWKRDRVRTEAFLWKHARSLPRTVVTVATERAPREFRTRLRARASGPGRPGTLGRNDRGFARARRGYGSLPGPTRAPRTPLER